MPGEEIPIRNWRVVPCEGGYLLFIDPRRETVKLFLGMDPKMTHAQKVRLTPEERFVQETLFGGDLFSEVEVDGVDGAAPSAPHAPPEGT